MDAGASSTASDAQAVLHVGEVRAIIRCKDADYAVLCEFDPLDGEAGCPLGDRYCTRLK